VTRALGEPRERQPRRLSVRDKRTRRRTATRKEGGQRSPTARWSVPAQQCGQGARTPPTTPPHSPHTGTTALLPPTEYDPPRSHNGQPRPHLPRAATPSHGEGRQTDAAGGTSARSSTTRGMAALTFHSAATPPRPSRPTRDASHTLAAAAGAWGRDGRSRAVPRARGGGLQAGTPPVHAEGQRRQPSSCDGQASTTSLIQTSFHPTYMPRGTCL